MQRSGSAGAAAVVDAPGARRSRPAARRGALPREPGRDRRASVERTGRDARTPSSRSRDLVVDFPLERPCRARGRRPLPRRSGRASGSASSASRAPASRPSRWRPRAARGARPDPRRLDQARRARAARRRRRRAPHRARRPDRDDLPGRARLAEPGQDDRLPARRGDPAAHATRGKADAVERAVELLAEVGVQTPASAARPVPARVLGRHAPARDDRDGAGVRPRAAHRRRADDGARRDDAGGRDRPPPPPRPRSGRWP